MSTEHNHPERPSGARCAQHPAQPAIGTCSRCGNFYCPDCAGRRDGTQAFCRSCHDGRAYVAWEDRSLSLWQRYYQTVRASFADMQKFVAELPERGGVSQPLLYALIPTVVSTLVATGMLSGFMTLMLASALPSGPDNDMPSWAIGLLVFVTYSGMGIGSHLGYLMIWPAVVLGSARLFGIKHLHYEGVFRVLCYASGMNFLYFVPLIGMAVMVYHLVISAMGIAAQARTTVATGFGIVLAPAALLFGCCCAGYVAIIALAAQGTP